MGNCAVLGLKAALILADVVIIIFLILNTSYTFIPTPVFMIFIKLTDGLA